jgi:hypothetical protein
MPAPWRGAWWWTYRQLVERWRKILPTQSTVLDICPAVAPPGDAGRQGAPEAR